VDPEARPEQGLRIDPVRVGRGRSLVPPALVVVVSVAFFGLAVAKPWDIQRGTIAVASGSGALRSPAASGGQSATPTGPVAAPTPYVTPATLADLVAASSDRHAWGVRAVVVPSNGEPTGDGSGRGLAERWLAINVDAGAAWDVGVTGTAVEAGDDVVALGVTTPDDALPLDVRFWRLEEGGGIRRIVARPVPGLEAGSWLFLPALNAATVLGTWPAGTYRIDVLLGSRIVRLLTIVPSGVTAVSGEAPKPAEPADPLAGLRSFGAGPFAATPRGVIAISASPHEPLDERTAWLGPATGQVEIAAVGQVAADDVTSLGLLLEPGDEFMAADLERIAPVAEKTELFALGLPAEDALGEFAILLERPDLSPFETGLYLMTVTSKPASGKERTQTWNLEIVPSTIPPPPGMPLTRMARWVPLMTDLDRLAGEPLVSERDLGNAHGDGTCGGSAHIGTSDELFGIVEPPGFVVGQIRLFALDALRAVDLPVRFAPNAANGLTLVALPRGGLAARLYQLIVKSTSPAAPEGFLYAVCVT
jgi:hypothetical protein